LLAQILIEIAWRHQTPISIRIALLIVLVCVPLFYGFYQAWFISLRSLVLIPFQRFGWQSEQYTSNPVIRISSLIISIVIITLAIFTYQLGPKTSNGTYTISLAHLLGVVALLFLLKNLVNKIYFSLHKSADIGNQLTDFQYSLNQWFTLFLLVILVTDAFYARLQGEFFTLVMILTTVYFLVRLFGTIFLLQSNFKYPTFTLFVYLCTVEIVPALVLAKLLFVNS
jgi:hypothetical protein